MKKNVNSQSRLPGQRACRGPSPGSFSGPKLLARLGRWQVAGRETASALSISAYDGVLIMDRAASAARAGVAFREHPPP